MENDHITNAFIDYAISSQLQEKLVETGTGLNIFHNCHHETNNHYYLLKQNDS